MTKSTRNLSVLSTLLQVLLPHDLKKTTQMFFTSGQQFDIFAVLNDTLGENCVFGLPEFQWPNEKTSETTISMLHHALARPHWKCRHLYIHMDNCAG